MSKLLLLEIRNIDVGYGRKQVLHDVSLTLERGCMVGLVGTNGAGKSTTLKVIGGILRQWKGDVLCEGQEISALPPHKRTRLGIGFLLPGGQVFPGMTVSENLRISRTLRSSAATDSDAPFDWFPELQRKATIRAGLLSGGERQLLAVSLVLMQKPKILLLDEPTEGLTHELGLRVFDRIARHVAETHACALLVEHNTSFILRFCTTIHFMTQGRREHVLDSTAPDAEAKLRNFYFEDTGTPSNRPRTIEPNK